jgi:hypothetical protein
VVVVVVVVVGSRGGGGGEKSHGRPEQVNNKTGVFLVQATCHFSRIKNLGFSAMFRIKQ